jgi:hypothetical protein
MLTIGFSSHHAEALPFARHHMEQHQVIVLEEPPSPHFSAMLDGSLCIAEYIMELDSGFPEFELRMCRLLRNFHRDGRLIIQIEPYLEALLQIHELLAEGKVPEEIVSEPSLKDIYEAENRATGALITYYKLSVQAPFERVVTAVKDFARVDAKRLTLRERLRAQAIAPLTKSGESVYVEAGYIHYPLYRYLRQAIGPGKKIRVVFLLEPVVKRLKGRRRNLGPGDVLTLHYAFHDDLQKDVADLLAARSLIYIKLIQKEELLPGPSDAPHCEDEVRVNRLVDGLSFEDCKILFTRIRLAKREEALRVLINLATAR